MPGRAVYLIIGPIAALDRMIGSMRRTDFHFDLPQELIAQRPSATRSASRMLALDGADGSRRDLQFRDFPSLLESADLLVFNDTRVIPARAFGLKESGGRVEILLEPALTANTARVDDIEGHEMHEEYLEVPEAACDAINAARAAGGRVIAVGTTVVRSLETAALAPEGEFRANGRGAADAAGGREREGEREPGRRGEHGIAPYKGVTRI